MAAGVALLLLAAPAAAQTPDPDAPPPGWTGSFGAGLAMTQGNSDTSTMNVAYDLKWDAGAPLTFKSTGLYIRGKSEGELTTDRLAFEGRADRKWFNGTSVYGQVQYLSDEFKEIDYLVSPTVGLARQLVKNDRTELGVDAGVGLVWEKNAGVDVTTRGALTAGQNFRFQLSETAEITQRVSALWPMSEFSDGLYITGLGLAANLTSRTQFKGEVLNTLKNRPPDGVNKNDVAILLSLVYKF